MRTEDKFMSQALEWMSGFIPAIQKNAPAPKYATPDEYRLTRALCEIDLGAEFCNPTTNPWANSILSIFKDDAPVHFSWRDDTSGKDVLEFSRSGNDYSLSCGKGECLMQKQPPAPSSASSGFWEAVNHLSLSCSTAPVSDGNEFDVIDTFQDSSNDEASESAKMTFCSTTNKYDLLGDSDCEEKSRNPNLWIQYDNPYCVRVNGVYFDGKMQKLESTSVESLIQYLATQPPPEIWTIDFSTQDNSYHYFGQFFDMQRSGDGSLSHPTWVSSDYIIEISVYPELSPPRLALSMSLDVFARDFNQSIGQCEVAYESPCAADQCE